MTEETPTPGEVVAAAEDDVDALTILALSHSSWLVRIAARARLDVLELVDLAREVAEQVGAGVTMPNWYDGTAPDLPDGFHVVSPFLYTAGGHLGHGNQIDCPDCIDVTTFGLAESRFIAPTAHVVALIRTGYPKLFQNEPVARQEIEGEWRTPEPDGFSEAARSDHARAAEKTAQAVHELTITTGAQTGTVGLCSCRLFSMVGPRDQIEAFHAQHIRDAR